jgi:hypothetical protein
MSTSRLSRCCTAFVLQVVFCLAPFLCLGATFTVNPSGDAFVTSGPSGNLSGNNYGGAGSLSVAAPGSPQGEFQSVLKFSLAGARSFFDGMYGTGQWSVESVTLALTSVAPGNPLFNQNRAGQFNISWMANAGWTEGSGKPTLPGTVGITFNTLPGFLGPQDQSLGTFGFSGVTGGTTTYNLNLASGLVTDILSGTDLSLRLNAADTSGRPLLTIVAVPEPGSFGLGTLGLGVFFGGRLLNRIRR